MPYTFISDRDAGEVAEKYECDWCRSVAEHKLQWGMPVDWYRITNINVGSLFACSAACGEALFKSRLAGRDELG